MLQGWRHNAVTILLYHDCIELVGTTLQQVWYYQQGCYKVVLTSLIQSWYNKNVTRLTTQVCNNIFISCLYRTSWNNLATSTTISTRLLQVVNELFQTCWQLGTSSVNTTCWRLVGRLATRCEIIACIKKRSLIQKIWRKILYRIQKFFQMSQVTSHFETKSSRYSD
jgi:hypothetical protein